MNDQKAPIDRCPYCGSDAEYYTKDYVCGSTRCYQIDGITENKPIYLDFEQIAAIVRVLSNE